MCCRSYYLGVKTLKISAVLFAPYRSACAQEDNVKRVINKSVVFVMLSFLKCSGLYLFLYNLIMCISRGEGHILLIDNARRKLMPPKQLTRCHQPSGPSLPIKSKYP